MFVTCQVLSHFQLPKANSLLQTEQQNVCHSFFTILKSRTLWKSHKNLVLSWLTDNMLEFIGNRHLLPFFGIFRIKSWICQSGATIVVQILSSASASKAPTAYFPLIKTLNNNYNLCSVSLSAVPKNWSHWATEWFIISLNSSYPGISCITLWADEWFLISVDSFKDLQVIELAECFATFPAS